MLNLVNLRVFGEFIPVERRLSTEKILLDTEWYLVRSDQDDYKYRMWITIFLKLGIYEANAQLYTLTARRWT
jgi:hypothetical protein